MWALLIVLNLFGGVLTDRSARWVNVKCDALDPSFCTYKECRLKVLGRGIVGLNIHALLLKGPFNNAKVHLSLWRKYSGFRPFMFNVTFDFCKFMDKDNKQLSFQNIIHETILKSSNVNHSCPYEKDIWIRNLVFKKKHFQYLPLPSGEYQLQLLAATDKIWRTKVYVNLLLEDDLKVS